MAVLSFQRKLRRNCEVRMTPTADARTTTIPAATPCLSTGYNQDGSDGSEDEGPFFDLEFSVPVEPCEVEEFNMSVSSSGNRLSSSSTLLTEEILLNGRLFEVESSSSSSSSSLLFSPAVSERSCKSQLSASVVKSATNLRVFMFRSSFKSRPSSSPKSIKEERKLYRDVILRYISKIKPLYMKVSNLRFSAPAPASQGTGLKKRSAMTGSSLSSRFKVVPGSLRKSRSASSAVASVFPPPVMTPRCDDSLLQQEDGIQGAIAHCKRSFSSEKGLWTTEPPLIRSMSDPGGERSTAGHGKIKVACGDNSSIC